MARRRNPSGSCPSSQISPSTGPGFRQAVASRKGEPGGAQEQTDRLEQTLGRAGLHPAACWARVGVSTLLSSAPLAGSGPLPVGLFPPLPCPFSHFS